MPQPLVLRHGRISEQLAGEEGVYPLLRLVAGRLVAGGSGTDLCFLAGRMAEIAAAVGGMWDGGTTLWDGPTTWVDATWDATWDGHTNWSE